MTTPPLPDHIELQRDRMWRRDEDLHVECALDAERFIEDVGFANTLTDTRRAELPSSLSESQIAGLGPIGSPSLRRPLRPSAVKKRSEKPTTENAEGFAEGAEKNLHNWVIRKYDSPRIWQNHPKG